MNSSSTCNMMPKVSSDAADTTSKKMDSVAPLTAPATVQPSKKRKEPSSSETPAESLITTKKPCQINSQGRSKPVEQWDGDTLVGVFPSTSAAARLTKVLLASIFRALKDENLMAGGYTWKLARPENLQWMFRKFEIHKVKTQEAPAFRLQGGKPVEQWDGDRLVGVFQSAHAAARVTDTPQPTISAVCRGDRTSAGGYTWKIARQENLHWMVRNFQVHKSKTIENFREPGKGWAVEQWDGNVLVGVFPSVFAAGLLTGVHRNSIWRACDGEQETAGGYRWKEAREENFHWLTRDFTVERCKSARGNQSKPVEQWDGDTLVGVFPSIRAAARLTGLPVTHLRKACFGHQEVDQVGGYQWKMASSENLNWLYKEFEIKKGKAAFPNGGRAVMKQVYDTQHATTAPLLPPVLPSNCSVHVTKEGGHDVVVLDDFSDTEEDNHSENNEDEDENENMAEPTISSPAAKVQENFETTISSPVEQVQEQAEPTISSPVEQAQTTNSEPVAKPSRKSIQVETIAKWLKEDVFHPDAEAEEARETAAELVGFGFRSQNMILADAELPDILQELEIIKLHKRAIQTAWQKHKNQ